MVRRIQPIKQALNVNRLSLIGSVVMCRYHVHRITILKIFPPNERRSVLEFFMFYPLSLVAPSSQLISEYIRP